MAARFASVFLLVVLAMTPPLSDANHRFLSCLTLRLDKPKKNCGKYLTIAKHTVNAYHAQGE